MSWRTKLRALVRKEKLDAEMSEEMRAHLELQAAENEKRGMSREEARHAALRAFGGVEQLKERAREQRPLHWLERGAQDLRQGARQLRRSPAFAVVAVLMLALGLGANTAIFSALYAVVLQPLPFPDSARLVSVRSLAQRDGRPERRPFSSPDFRDYRAQATQVFEGLSAYSDTNFNLTGQGEPVRIPGETVSGDYFATLGVVPALGRAFVPAEDAVPNQDRVVVLSDELWRGSFAGDPGVIGRQVKLDEHDYTIVGVAPAGFRGLTDSARAWVPLAIGGAGLWNNRGGRWLDVVGRRRPGVTPAQARAELNTISAGIAAANPAPNAEATAELASLQEELFGSLRQPLFVLFGAVGFVLAITCANVANLMLVRLATRRREVAIRLSLGASRGALARLFLGEAGAICAVGGALGVAIAYGSLLALKHFAPHGGPGLVTLGLQWPALGFALATASACAVVIAALPALLAARSDLDAALKEGGRSGRGGAAGARIRGALVVGEIGLSLALLLASALFVRSFINLLTQTPGYRTENLLLQRTVLPAARYNATARRTFIREVVARTAALPGVTNVAFGSDTPLDGEGSSSYFAVESDAPDPSAREGRAYLHGVTTAFFSTLGIPLLRGEPFAESYAANSEPVAIVSETLARRYWPGREAVGQRLRIGRSTATLWTRIVGVVGEAKYRNLAQTGPRDPDVYLALDQRPENHLTVVVSTSRSAGALASDLRAVVRTLDPNVPVVSDTIEERLARSTASQRLSAQLMGVFALVALALAAIGLYGVVSFSVGQRTQEIGVRMALGAPPGAIVRLVLRGTGRLVAIGLAVGTGLALGLTRFIESLLFNVNARDPLTFAAVAIVLALVALGAAWLPARRAAKVDPLVALRCE